GDHEGSLVELIEERFQLERTMRLEVLHAMRDAAIAEGAAQDHGVALNEHESARLRAAVDVEIPLHVPYPQYLENAAMHMSVAGLLDGPLPTGGTAGARTTGTGTTGAPTTGGTPGTTAPGTGTGTPATTPAAGAGDAQSRLTDILRDARENAGEARLGRLSGGDWLEIYQVRFDLE